MNKYKKIKKNTLVTAYDKVDKLTLLEWLKQIEKDIAKGSITKENEGEGILLTFKEDGALHKISVDMVGLQKILDAYQHKITKDFEGENIILDFDEKGNLLKINAVADIPVDVVTLSTGQNISGFKTFLNRNGISIGEPDTPISRRTFVRYDRIVYYVGDTENNLLFNNIATKIYLRDYVTSAIAPKQDKATLGADVEALGFLRESTHYIISRKVANHTLLWEYNDGVKGSTYIPYKLSDLEIDYHDETKQDKVTLDDDISALGYIKNTYHDATKQDKATLDQDVEALGYVKDTYHDATKQDKASLDTDVSALGYVKDTYHDETKQDKTDSGLETTDKTIVGAINEVNAKAEGGESAFVISTANGKNPNFVSDDYDITALQIELQDGTILPIADIKKGASIYVIEENVSDRWYSGDGHFIKLNADKPVLDDYQRKDSLDADVGAKGYIKEVSFSEIKGSANDNTSLQNALLQKVNKNDLDQDVGDLGYIKDTYHDETKQDKVTLDDDVAVLGYIKNTYHDATKQDKTDNTLITTAKTIVGAINELKNEQNSLDSRVESLEDSVSTLDSAKQDKATLDTDVEILGFIKISALENYATLSYVDNEISTLRTDVSKKQDKTDNALITSDKTIVGAINESKNRLDSHDTEISTLNNDKQDKATLDQDVGALGYIKTAPQVHLYEHTLRLTGGESEEALFIVACIKVITNSNAPLTSISSLLTILANGKYCGNGYLTSKDYKIHFLMEITKNSNNIIGDFEYGESPYSQEYTSIDTDTIRQII